MNREPDTLDLLGQRTSEAVLDWLHQKLGREYAITFGEPPDEEHCTLVVQHGATTIELAASNEILRRPTVSLLSAVVEQARAAIDAAG